MMFSKYKHSLTKITPSKKVNCGQHNITPSPKSDIKPPKGYNPPQKDTMRITTKATTLLNKYYPKNT
jgi:hypothetical protein